MTLIDLDLDIERTVEGGTAAPVHPAGETAESIATLLIIVANVAVRS